MAGRKKRILVHYTSGALGGQQMQLYNIACELRNLNFDVIWLVEASGYFSNAFRDSGGEVIDVSDRLTTTLSNSKLGRIMARRKILNEVLKEIIPDAVILSDTVTSLLLNLRNQVVIRMIGQDLVVYEKYFEYYKLLRIDRKIDFYLGWPKVYVDLIEKGVDSAKLVDWSYHAVDTNKFFPLESNKNILTRNKLGIDQNLLTIGWIGRLEQENQCTNTLLLGKALLDRGFRSFMLVFVGGGAWINGEEDKSFVKRFKQYAIDLGLSNHILFTGWVDFEEVNTYLNIMDIVPMLESDPAGGSILREAMSCGKVALSVLGKSRMQEAFMHPSNSILVSDIDFVEKAAIEIIQLSQDSLKMKMLGENARRYCEDNLSFGKQAADIKALIDNSF